MSEGEEELLLFYQQREEHFTGQLIKRLDELSARLAWMEERLAGLSGEWKDKGELEE